MEYTAQRVRAKTRAAVKRREDQVETEEMESGELNLIPYLDMVTNLMLFLLASISLTVLSQLDTMLPDKRAPSAATTTQPQTNPDEQPLKLIVAITGTQLQLFSLSGLEGSITDPTNPPKLVLPRSGKDGDGCDGPYMCESNSCSSETRKCVASKEQPQPVYDYRALNRALLEIATRRYSGKQRKLDTYQIILQADERIPYSTIVSSMAALRCALPDVGGDPKSCAMPVSAEELKRYEEKWAKATKKPAGNGPISSDGRVYDPERAAYDPKTMALFHEIAFSAGYE